MSMALRLQRSCLGLYLASVGLQVYAAGLALFGVTSFMPHAILGYLMIIGALFLVILTAVAKLPRRALMFSFIILSLAILQPVLVLVLRSSSPAIAAMHPLNAVLMIGLAVLIARNSGRSQGPA
jgi:energy-coupling factor transporter transmembrane protein EcfT